MNKDDIFCDQVVLGKVVSKDVIERWDNGRLINLEERLVDWLIALEERVAALEENP